MKYVQQFSTDNYGNWKLDIENSRKNAEHLKSIDSEQKEKGEILYRFFTLQVADGKAIYQITGIHKKSVSIHRCTGICLDEYADGLLGEENNIPINKAIELIQREDRLRAIFKK